jgi:hypothetical protein
MTDMHVMNALKVMLGGFINGVATFTFIAKGATVWGQGVIIIAACNKSDIVARPCPFQ